ncbi:MAG: CDP-alcohol phosphatidyltransferase family protein [Micrococcales bacterium]|nr:CDP-alcohol phosphatidyltransferase family protein [Micrococcales bacterium]MCL2666821.1 CDP-alcohol phosphatidyltransferase family protein [Micrococcales bacterium]
MDVTTDRVLTVPNAISAARLVLVPVFAVLLARRQDVAALVVLGVSGASDWLDGVLARRLGQVSKLGQVLDPAADRLFVLVTIVALAWRGVVPWWLVAVLVARDVALGVVQLVVVRAGWEPLPVHLAGKTATLMLLYAFPLLLLADLVSGGPAALPVLVTALGWATALWGVALYWTSGVFYLVQARQVLRGGAP